MTMSEVADLVGGRLLAPERDGIVRIEAVSGIEAGEPGTIAFCAHQKYVKLIEGTEASAVLVEAHLIDGADLPMKPVIAVEQADYAFAVVAEKLMADYPPREPGVHPSAVIAETAELGEGVCIQPFAVVDAYAVVGAGTVLEAFAYVGYRARIGRGCHLYQQTVVREHCVLGEGVILQPGAIVGGDGFGYVPVDGKPAKIPQLGSVVLDDGVELGANTAVDRARFAATHLGPMVKIDNLCQIAHNVEIGAGTMMAAQSGIAGSTKVGKGVLMGGKVGLADHMSVGDGAQIGAGTNARTDLAAGTAYLGFVAQEAREGARVMMAQRKLPALIRRVRELEDRLDKLADQK